MKTAIASSLHM